MLLRFDKSPVKKSIALTGLTFNEAILISGTVSEFKTFFIKAIQLSEV